MLKILTVFILIVLMCKVNAQVETKYRHSLSDFPMYDKYTGDKITDKDLEELVKENPKLSIIPQINKHGNIWSFIIDPRNEGVSIERDTSLRVKPGEKFLPFVMKSTTGKILDSEKLTGKPILIHCQFFLKPPLFIEDAYNKTSKLVESKRESDEVVFILLTESEKRDMDKQIEAVCNIAHIIPDSRNFMVRYLITSSPTNILVDKNGNLVSYYDSLEIEKLKQDLSNL